MNTTIYDKVARLNDVFGIWNVNNTIRVTYVSKGWLVVWDHRQRPPVRHDCKASNHADVCALAVSKLEELTR